MREPVIVDNLFEPHYYEYISEALKSVIVQENSYDEGFGRYCLSDTRNPLLREAFTRSVWKARRVFNSHSLLPSYAFFAQYQKNGNAIPNLFHHKDDNACTYTLDMCLYQNRPWDLFVEGKSYTLMPNQALAYYGNEQEHWREAIPDPENQIVGMVFFHFVEPDHWFYTKGPDYIDVIRGQVTEEQWTTNRPK